MRRWPGGIVARHTVALLVMALGVACTAGEPVDEGVQLPQLLTTDLPFAYPPELYIQRIEGDVALQLYVDSAGLVVKDSTRVTEPSAHPAFDASAIAGAEYLMFRPAQRGEQRIGHTIILPVQFRVPKDTTVRDTTSR